jgi:polyhydroxybutyrate depolymerase
MAWLSRVSRSLTILGVLCFAVALPGTASAALSPGLHLDLSLVHDSVTRTYDVLVPAGYDGSVPVPLVVDMHGFISNKGQQRSASSFAALAQTETFIVAWPQGLFTDGDLVTNTGGPAWNAGGFCCGEAAVQNTDDVGFILAMVNAIAGEANVDPLRVYASGLSNGSAMTHRLMCEAGNVFAAAAAFSFPNALVTPCTPSRAIPILMVESRTDQIIPYLGGHVLNDPSLATVASAAQGFAEWRTRAGCTGSMPDVVEDQGTTSECEFFTNCNEGVAVGLCSVDAGAGLLGHVPYPGLIPDGFNSTQRAWAFLSSYQLPAAPPPIPGVSAVGLLVLAALLAIVAVRREASPMRRRS